ncbi:hypothetical protein H4Q26_003236 [Puccinia striiformis f. sp. tritici PST-130]|nr:hypothetical protein H4Q26_003236 [Puccinia striiformis f. sp. tritici PST-130]
MNHQIYERIPLPVLPFHVYRAQLDGPSTATTSSILPTPPGSFKVLGEDLSGYSGGSRYACMVLGVRPPSPVSRGCLGDFTVQ